MDEYTINKVDDINVIEILSNDFGFELSKLMIDNIQDIKQNSSKFIFNLKKVEYIDSSAIGLMMSCYNSDKKEKIRICNLDNEIIEFLKPMKLDMIIDFYNSYEEALESFNK